MQVFVTIRLNSSNDLFFLPHRLPVVHGNVNAAKTAKSLLDMAKEEIYSIRLCDECYISFTQNRRFDTVCKQPHLVVWAKQKSYPYWPAKLMSVSATTNKVEVRYFGEKHYRAVLTPKDCYLYSIDRPSIWLGCHKKEFEKAQYASVAFVSFHGNCLPFLMCFVEFAGGRCVHTARD